MVETAELAEKNTKMIRILKTVEKDLRESTHSKNGIVGRLGREKSRKNENSESERVRIYYALSSKSQKKRIYNSSFYFRMLLNFFILQTTKLPTMQSRRYSASFMSRIFPRPRKSPKEYLNNLGSLPKAE